MMKFELTKQNIAVIAALLMLFSISTYFAIQLIHKKELMPNEFQCRDQKAPFRVNISDCYDITANPSDSLLTDTLTSPEVSEIVLLFDPNETGGTALAAFDIFKTFRALEPETGVKAGVAYTKYREDQPLILNTSIDYATFSNPIIWLRQNQTETKVIVDGPKIFVNAKTQQDMDAAACKISILVIKKVMEC